MCTTFIVGDKATVDDSFLVARSADSSALKAQLFIIHPACYYPEGAMYRTKDHNGATDFSYPQPVHAMRYTSVPNWQTKLHGAVGFNEAGLGVTGTESIFARDDALAIDPYNKETGITEDDIIDVILPRCHTAAEGVELLGKIIETHGAVKASVLHLLMTTKFGTWKPVQVISGWLREFRKTFTSVPAIRDVCVFMIRMPPNLKAAPI